MGVEIELKVRLDDFEPVRERLFIIGDYCRAYLKSDTYWLGQQASPIPPSGVRVRHEKGVNAGGDAFDSILVTYKTKEISNGIEINDETEFTISDAAPFEELLSRFGLRPAYHKKKKGWAWLVRHDIPSAADGISAILAELSLVEGLGWFLEIEIQLAPIAANRQTIEECRRRLLALLETLEIPATQIESRPYTVMLKEAS